MAGCGDFGPRVCKAEMGGLESCLENRSFNSVMSLLLRLAFAIVFAKPLDHAGIGGRHFEIHLTHAGF